MKVGIIFWGLTRSLKYTLDSIHHNVFNVLRNDGIEYDVCMHTYTLKNHYSNTRNNELPIILNNDEYKLLNPTHLIIDSQEEVHTKLNISQYKTQPDPWHNNYETLEYFILSMYSKNKITQYLIDNNIIYDKLLFIRPDVKYKTKFDVTWLNRADDYEILIPNNCVFNGFNDRMCLSNYKTGLKYGTIFNYLLEYGKHKSLHSETAIKEIMKRIEPNLKIIFIHFHFNRVRTNGEELDDWVYLLINTNSV
jgi:hypothetical protein